MIFSSLLAFWGVSLAFVLMPGAEWAYAIASGLGRRRVLPAVSGMLAGHVMVLVAVVAGAAALLARSPGAMTALTVVGGGYLIWLGVGALRHARSGTGVAVAAGTARGWFAKGVGVTLLNPKVPLLLLALLPQFVSAHAAWGATPQLAVLAVVHLLNLAVVYLPVAYGAGALLSHRPRAATAVQLVSGVLMIALGGFFVAEQLLSHLP